MSDFTMPSLGADMVEGTLLEWLVKPGDTVHRGDIVAVVDTAKAAVEIETFTDGVVADLLVAPGTKVPVGGVLATFGPLGTAAVAEPAPAKRPGRRAAKRPVKRAAKAAVVPTAEPAKEPARVPTPPVPPARVRATPHARRVAAELGIDIVALARPGGPPVRAQDVLAAAAQLTPAPGAPAPQPAAPPTVIPAPSAGGARVSGPDAMRQAIARLMSRSKREIPHYYLSTTVDLGRAMDWLHEQNRTLPVSSRLVPAALLLKATALAAEANPAVNGFWVDDAFRPAAQVHLGLAISLRGGGLVAPALHDAAHLGLADLMAQMRDLVARARAGRLRGSELSDPTITVTNLGEQGVEAVHGVIYPPQVALVGFGRIVERPWAVDGLIGVRPLTTLTLSGDHRATDGFTGARFLADIEQRLQLPEEL